MHRYAVSAALVTMFTCAVADAAQVKGIFSGEVWGVADPSSLLPPEIVAGAGISGEFTYETSNVTKTHFANLIFYEFPDNDLEISVTVATYTWVATTSPPNRSTVANNEMTFRDRFTLQTNAATQSFPFNQGSVLISFDLEDASFPYELVGHTALPLTNDDVNVAATSDPNGQRSLLRSQEEDESNRWLIYFDVSTLDLNTVVSVSSSTWGAIKDLFR